MTSAGAGIIVAHVDLTTSRSIDAQTALSLDDRVANVVAIADATRSVRQDVLALCHVRPIAMAEDAQ